MRLIDADALKSGFNSDNFQGFVIQKVIDMAPTIEPVRGEWISVQDRLPTAREDVLVVAYWHEKYQSLMGWFSPNGKVWRVTTPNEEMTDVSVTHWMPLPEPPKEESKCQK